MGLVLEVSLLSLAPPSLALLLVELVVVVEVVDFLQFQVGAVAEVECWQDLLCLAAMEVAAECFQIGLEVVEEYFQTRLAVVAECLKVGLGHLLGSEEVAGCWTHRLEE